MAQQDSSGGARMKTPPQSATDEETLHIRGVVEPEQTGASGELPNDRELADRILKASNKLQNAVDDAVGAGLVVEPAFTRIEGRMRGTGNAMASYICNVKLFRKLT